MNEQQEELLYDASESIWKVDGPIGRLEFFWVQLGISLLLVLPTGLIMTVMPFLFPIAIILGLVGLYLAFVATFKRFYDITGELKTGIIVVIVMILLGVVFKPIGYILTALCLFMPGKYIK